MAAKGKQDKELYRELRQRSCDQLRAEMTKFDATNPNARLEHVSLLRAVGVVFSETGTPEEIEIARVWLRSLLQDREEKIRRYAMTALPKLGANPADEKKVLEVLRTTASDREKKSAAKTLEKIGGAESLREVPSGSQQKIKATLARLETPSSIRLDAVLANFAGFRIHLRGRFGLEQIVREECEERFKAHRKFQVIEVRPGLVALNPVAPFSLSDLYELRCFGTLGFALKATRDKSRGTLAAMITSPVSKRILNGFTQGPIRYRLDFVSKGHQRAVVREIANRVYAIEPKILNSPQAAPWTIAIHQSAAGDYVELCPRIVPDPRYYYRQKDVPAASHPPLAACMSRLAGPLANDVVWDPFCGSGLELIERALLGGVRAIYGTDRDQDAIEIAKKNFAAAALPNLEPQFIVTDFREFLTVAKLPPGSVSLIITNPPMGKRVPIPNLRELIDDLFRVAAVALKPGGRLVFANPLRMETSERALKLKSRQTIDLGGFDCRLEKYVR